MPKENTHLYFAHQVVEGLPDAKIAELIRQEMGVFYFGSVLPDLFYYSKNHEQAYISEYLHGKDGNPTNELIFLLLKKAKETQRDKDLVFALGYITHCVLDQIFHPVIYYLSGNYYNPDETKAQEAVYLHRHLETWLDCQINQEFFYDRLIKPSLLKDLSFDEVLEKKFEIPKSAIVDTLRRKTFILRLIRHNIFFFPIKFLHSIGLIRIKTLLGIFYGNLISDRRSIPSPIAYRDLVTGAEKTTNLDELFAQARASANERLLTAIDYYHGKIHSAEARLVIKGESLDTGQEDCPVTKIKYFLGSV